MRCMGWSSVIWEWFEPFGLEGIDRILRIVSLATCSFDQCPSWFVTAAWEGVVSVASRNDERFFVPLPVKESFGSLPPQEAITGKEESVRKKLKNNLALIKWGKVKP